MLSMSDAADKTCRVCGDQASGLYFGAIVCLPCKSFYIRSTKDGKPDFVCMFNGTCDITKCSRLRCQACRFKRCLQAGMTRKEKPIVVVPTAGQDLCAVCGDIANGVHFGKPTCEGCKKFFRRAMKEYLTYECNKSRKCIVNPRTRNDCRYCRYQRASQAGMSREAIKMGRPRRSNEEENFNGSPSKRVKKEPQAKANSEGGSPTSDSSGTFSDSTRFNIAGPMLQYRNVSQLYPEFCSPANMPPLPPSVSPPPSQLLNLITNRPVTRHQQHPYHEEGHATTTTAMAMRSTRLPSEVISGDTFNPDVILTEDEVKQELVFLSEVRHYNHVLQAGSEEAKHSGNMVPERRMLQPYQNQPHSQNVEQKARETTLESQEAPPQIEEGTRYMQTRGAKHQITKTEDRAKGETVEAKDVDHGKGGDSGEKQNSKAPIRKHVCRKSFEFQYGSIPDAHEIPEIFEQAFWENKSHSLHNHSGLTDIQWQLIHVLQSSFITLVQDTEEPRATKKFFDPPPSGYFPDDEDERIPLLKVVGLRIITTSNAMVDYIKSLPGHLSLGCADLGHLCKQSFINTLYIMEALERYNPVTDNFTYFWNWKLRPCEYPYKYRNELLSHGKKIHALKMDPVEKALFVAFTLIAPDWVGLKEAGKVNHLHSIYFDALKSYLVSKGKGEERLQAILSMVIPARELAIRQFDVVDKLAFDFDNHELSNLLPVESLDSLLMATS